MVKVNESCACFKIGWLSANSIIALNLQNWDQWEIQIRTQGDVVAVSDGEDKEGILQWCCVLQIIIVRMSSQYNEIKQWQYNDNRSIRQNYAYEVRVSKEIFWTTTKDNVNSLFGRLHTSLWLTINTLLIRPTIGAKSEARFQSFALNWSYLNLSRGWDSINCEWHGP